MKRNLFLRLTIYTFLFLLLLYVRDLSTACVVLFLITLLDLFFSFGHVFLFFIYRVEPLPEDEAQQIYRMNNSLSEVYGDDAPELFVLPSACANAFALRSRQGHIKIILGQGLFRILQEEELKAVLVYLQQLGLSYNVKQKTGFAVAGSLIYEILNRSLKLIKRMIGMKEREKISKIPKIVFPLIKVWQALIRKLFSEQEMNQIDCVVAKLTENPLYLASALSKMEQDLLEYPLLNVNPMTAHLFLLNPLRHERELNREGFQRNVDLRIKNLEMQARQLGF